MALQPTVDIQYEKSDGEFVVPVGMASKWRRIISHGAQSPGLSAADADPITAPLTDITHPDNRIFRRGGNKGGTHIVLRVAYGSGTTAMTTSPRFKVFGRYDDTGTWQILRNKAGDISITVTPDPTNDVVSGGYKRTTPDPENDYVDSAGCNEFLIGIEEGFDGDGDDSDTYLEVKFV